MSFWDLKSWVKVPSGYLDCYKLSAACFPPLLNILRASAKNSDAFPYRLWTYLLTVLNSFHHIANSVFKVLCCFFLPIFMLLSLSFTPFCALTLFPWAHSFFWSIRAVSLSCFCLTPSLSVPLKDFSLHVLEESELPSWSAPESQLLLQHKILLNLQERRKQSTGVVEETKERGDEKWKLIGWSNSRFVAATRKWQQQ